jgi:hypothetical protein
MPISGAREGRRGGAPGTRGAMGAGRSRRDRDAGARRRDRAFSHFSDEARASAVGCGGSAPVDARGADAHALRLHAGDQRLSRRASATPPLASARHFADQRQQDGATPHGARARPAAPIALRSTHVPRVLDCSRRNAPQTHGSTSAKEAPLSTSLRTRVRGALLEKLSRRRPTERHAPPRRQAPRRHLVDPLPNEARERSTP